MRLECCYTSVRYFSPEWISHFVFHSTQLPVSHTKRCARCTWNTVLSHRLKNKWNFRLDNKDEIPKSFGSMWNMKIEIQTWNAKKEKKNKQIKLDSFEHSFLLFFFIFFPRKREKSWPTLFICIYIYIYLKHVCTCVYLWSGLTSHIIKKLGHHKHFSFFCFVRIVQCTAYGSHTIYALPTLYCDRKKNKIEEKQFFFVSKMKLKKMK